MEKTLKAVGTGNKALDVDRSADPVWYTTCCQALDGALFYSCSEPSGQNPPGEVVRSLQCGFLGPKTCSLSRVNAWIAYCAIAGWRESQVERGGL